MDPSTHSSLPSRRRTAPTALIVALTLLLALAGCGGGGAGTTTTGGEEDDGNGPRTQPGERGQVGDVISDFSIKVQSATAAQLSATLSKGAVLELAVRRVAGANVEKVGEVTFGDKPAGRVSITWDLKVEGKQLAAGRYRVRLRTENAKSPQVNITVPG